MSAGAGCYAGLLCGSLRQLPWALAAMTDLMSIGCMFACWFRRLVGVSLQQPRLMRTAEMWNALNFLTSPFGNFDR